MDWTRGGRTRVSQITTLGDYKMLGADEPLLLNSAGTGTGAWADNKYTMSVAGTQYLVRQSNRVHPYFSGKSQMIEITFDKFQHEAGVVKRVGYFSSSTTPPYTDNLDGLFLESDGTNYYFRSYRNGVLTCSVRDQGWDNWSEVHDYDWSFFTVILIDFLWLGGAIARLWLKTKNGFVLVHTINYSGTMLDTFIRNPYQPLRMEIRSTNAGGQMRYICSQVATEGSVEEAGQSVSVDTGATGITLAVIGTTYPLIAVRKKAASLNAVARVEGLSLDVASANDRLLWSLQINPTLSAGLTYADVTNFPIQKASGDGTITVSAAGTQIAGGFLSTGNILPSNLVRANYLLTLGQTIAGVMDQVVLCCTPITVSVVASGEISLKKY